MPESMADSALRPPIPGDADHTDHVIGLLDAIMSGECLYDEEVDGLLTIYGDTEAQRALVFGLYNCGLITDDQRAFFHYRLPVPEV